MNYTLPHNQITARHVADYFIQQSHINEDKGDVITQLKVQKLVYYAYVWLYGLTGRELFKEGFAAWSYGPVAESLYQDLKRHGRKPIDSVKNDPELLPADITEHLKNIWQSYGQYSATKLVDMTHKEKPWQDAFEAKSNISKDVIKTFYSYEADNVAKIMPEGTAIRKKYGGELYFSKLSDDMMESLEDDNFEELDLKNL